MSNPNEQIEGSPAGAEELLQKEPQEVAPEDLDAISAGYGTATTTYTQQTQQHG